MKYADMTQEDRDLNAAIQANFARQEAERKAAEEARKEALDAILADIPANDQSIVTLREKVNLLLALHRGEDI
jgi:hypothetical protein